MRERNCYEVYYRTGMNLFLTIVGIYVATMLIACLVNSTVNSGIINYIDVWLGAIGVIVVIFAPFIIYYACKFAYYRKVKLTCFQEVVLEHAVTGNMKGIGFTVDAVVNGNRSTFETKHIFSTNGLFAQLPVDKYSGQRVIIGYNEDKDEIVIMELTRKRKTK